MRAHAAILCSMMLGACSLLEERSPPGLDEPAAEDPNAPPPPLPPGTPADDRGAVWYATMCASCHGALGEGAVGPALDQWMRPRAELVSIIDTRMPLGGPDRCRGDCAEAVAGYILDALQVEAPSCEERPLPERTLRLLTRREYERTVRDLLHVDAMPCSSDAQCDVLRASCSAGACTPDACTTRTFAFDPGGRTHTSVVVAGDFNGWAADAAAGGWVMTYHAALGRWIAKHDLADGTYRYKFVVDGSEWRADPGNPRTEADGFGGFNSVVAVDCRGAPAIADVPADPARNFPVESRPSGYAFDNNAGAGLATAVHVTEWMDAAAALAAAAAARLDRLLPCDPAAGAAACAERFARDFGRRAFRRPLEAAELAKYRALILAEPSFEDGVSIAVQVMLSSPSFLYRSELGVEVAPGRFRLTPYELASALSYTFWGTMPDEALFAAAERGALDTADGIEAEARRLLTDPRARETFGVFAIQWLGVEPILSTTKHPGTYPQVDEALRGAMLAETAELAAHVAFDSTHAFGELLEAQYGFMNARLAAVYGVAGVSGDRLVRAQHPAGRRAGVLGLASVLGTYAHSDQSSPIKRGVFVRERLLCEKFGVPPPDAGGLPEVDPTATTRERFAMHTAKESCRGCHQYIDGVGFGFERFDAIGAYRDTENGRPIDAAGDMNDVEGFGAGTSAPYATLPELAAILAGSERAKSCFATQWYRFSRGSLDTAEDRCALEEIVQKFGASGWDLRELMIAVVTSEGFALRR